MDEILPFEWGITNDKYFRELGADVTFQTYAEGHIVSSKNQQDFMKWIIDKEVKVL
jgi:phospholipase/carboxylesterase